MVFEQLNHVWLYPVTADASQEKPPLFFTMKQPQDWNISQEEQHLLQHR